MNLLKDKREHERQANAPIFEEPAPNYGDAKTEPSFSMNAYEKPKTKNTLGTFLIASLIFILAVVVTYFGFYKPKTRLGGSGSEGNVAAIDTTAETLQDSVNLPIGQVDTSTTAAVGLAGDSHSSLVVAAELMRQIADLLNASTQVSALFFDEGSFSVELRAASPEGAGRVYSTFQQLVPANVKLTSAAPVNNSSALIAGTFTASLTTSGSSLTNSEVDAKIRDIAGASGTTVASLDIGERTGDLRLVFAKIAGPFDSCRLLLENLAHENLNITVSKLILMPAGAGDYFFVLRFYL